MKIVIRQIILFVVTGGLQVAVDSGILVGLTSVGASIITANILGRMAGAGVGFFINGTTTFASQTGSRLSRDHLGRFVATWTVLTITSTVVLGLAQHHVTIGWIWILKPLLEMALALISFLAAKFWIYK